MPFGEALAGKSGVCAVKVEFDGRGITHPKGGALAPCCSVAKHGETRRNDLDGASGQSP
jgi:hypothetical protein